MFYFSFFLVFNLNQTNMFHFALMFNFTSMYIQFHHCLLSLIVLDFKENQTQPKKIKFKSHAQTFLSVSSLSVAVDCAQDKSTFLCWSLCVGSAEQLPHRHQTFLMFINININLSLYLFVLLLNIWSVIWSTFFGKQNSAS